LDQKNSPSRFRFRPPVALTFGFRLLPSPLASTYSRPVLGASGNLAVVKGSIKSVRGGKNRYLRIFQFSTFPQLVPRLWTACHDRLAPIGVEEGCASCLMD
jgi:hypothetical protein